MGERTQCPLTHTPHGFPLYELTLPSVAGLTIRSRTPEIIMMWELSSGKCSIGLYFFRATIIGYITW